MPQWAIMRVCVSACSRLGQPHLCGTKLDDAGDNLAYAGERRIFINFLFRRSKYRRIWIASAVAETCRQPVVSLSFSSPCQPYVRCDCGAHFALPGEPRPPSEPRLGGKLVGMSAGLQICHMGPSTSGILLPGCVSFQGGQPGRGKQYPSCMQSLA